MKILILLLLSAVFLTSIMMSGGTFILSVLGDKAMQAPCIWSLVVAIITAILADKISKIVL